MINNSAIDYVTTGEEPEGGQLPSHSTPSEPSLLKNYDEQRHQHREICL